MDQTRAKMRSNIGATHDQDLGNYANLV